MGSQFAIAFDIISAAIIVLMFFAGWRRGLTNMVLGLASAVVAFTAAVLLSTPISEKVYNDYIEAPLTEKIEEAVDGSLSSLSLDSFSDMEYEGVYISGTAADKIEPEYSGRDSAVIDLTNVDISTIGLTSEDLEFLGLEPTFKLSSVNMKTAEFKRAEVEKEGLGKLAVSQFIAINLIKKGDLKDFNKFIELVDRYIPGKKMQISSESITVSYVRKFVLGMLNSRAALTDTVMTDFVRPNCVIVIRTVAFVLIYIVVFAIMRFIATASKLIDKIPVIGGVNSLLGGIAGAVEGILIVFIFCLATRLVVSLLDGDVMIFNQETIDKTFLFKAIYDFNFLNFLT